MNGKKTRFVVLLFAASLLATGLNDLSSRTNTENSVGVTRSLPRPSDAVEAGWAKGGDALQPPGVAGSMMAYDSANGVFVLFGGSDGKVLNQTWILDPRSRAWTKEAPISSPPARADAMFTYDSRAGAFVLFGGWYETADDQYHRFSDTWAFFVANHTWMERSPRTSPSPRSDAAVAFDTANGITLLFGGFDGERYLGDLWSYRFADDDWVPRQTSVLPSARADGRMAYDLQSRFFFLFSGNDYSDASFNFHHLADMWRYSWSDNAWVQIFPDVLPMPRDYSVFASDHAFGELLLVGGYGNRTILGDIWSFNTTRLVWRNISTPGGPSPRMAAVGGYDPVEDILAIFGGGDRSEVKIDTWFFRYPPPLSGNIFVSSPNPVSGERVAFHVDMVGGSGEVSRVRWDFGDGQTSLDPSAVHTYGSPGIYRIQLEAVDSRNGRISFTLNLEVGFLVPFWMGISILVAGSVFSSIGIFLWARNRRKSGV